MPETEDHWGIKDILGGVVGGGILAALGVWMIINPDGASTTGSSSKRRLLRDLLDAIWGVPGGIILGLVGVLIVWATVHQAMKQTKGPKQ
ncbi:MAG: hypothetical protein KC996_04015 [Phycisphaerales bacterium]|nr:hypothetical protein [Phycisphaerales bacterium]